MILVYLPMFSYLRNPLELVLNTYHQSLLSKSKMAAKDFDMWISKLPLYKVWYTQEADFGGFTHVFVPKKSIENKIR